MLTQDQLVDCNAMPRLVELTAEMRNPKHSEVTENVAQNPQGKKVGEPTFDGFPEAVRAAIEGWLDTECKVENAGWALAKRSWDIKSACDADKTVAEKEKRSSIQIGVVVKKCLGASKGVFYDGLNSWQLLLSAGLNVDKLPPRSYWNFVRLGRLFKQECKSARIHAEQPGKATRKTQVLEGEFSKAAAAYAADPQGRILEKFIELHKRKLKPHATIENGRIPLEIQDRTPMATTSFVDELKMRYDGDVFRGPSIGVIVVDLQAMDGQSVSSALNEPKVQQTAAYAARLGKDVWICFRAQQPTDAKFSSETVPFEKGAA
ncbi:MAG: hypothetical protein WCT04_27740 [Planctomycetota bacterium]